MKIDRDDMGTLLKVAEKIFESGVCPKEITTPQACFAVMLAGAELGLGPMQSLRCIQIVKNKLSFTSEFTVAQCVSDPRCKYFKLIESTDKVAIFETQRDGATEPTRLSWTIQHAQRAGLLSNNTWKSHPEAMLRARCAAALARAVYPDLTNGVRTPDEVEEIELSHAPAQLPPPRTERAPQEPPARAPVESSEPPAVHPALGAFYLRLEAVELPGEAVAVWLKHREEIEAAGSAVRDAAWRALCGHTRKVGKMDKPELWLEKALAEEDALRDAQSRLAAANETTDGPRLDEPPALVTYRARCAAATTLAALAATCLELSPSVQEHRGRAWELACARAHDLGETPETLTKECAWGAGITKDPAVWRTVAAVVVAIDAATTTAAVAAAVKAHGVAVAALPKALKDALNDLRSGRLKALASPPTDVAAQIEDEIKRAQTAADLDAAGERVEREVKAGRITADQAAALAALHETAAAAIEKGMAA
jgi:hypothetical protein